MYVYCSQNVRLDHTPIFLSQVYSGSGSFQYEIYKNVQRMQTQTGLRNTYVTTIVVSLSKFSCRPSRSKPPLQLRTRTMARSQDPAIRLPAEIFERIIAVDVLQTNPTDWSPHSRRPTNTHMRACVLVSRSWREICLPFLLDTVVIWLPDDALHPTAFLRFLDQKPHLAKLVKKLTFYSSHDDNGVDTHEVSTTMLAHILAKLPRIQYLRLETMNLALEGDDLTLQTLPPIDIAELELDIVRQEVMRLPHLPSLLSIFGTIGVLRLEESDSTMELFQLSHYQRGHGIPPSKTKIMALEGDLMGGVWSCPLLALASLEVLQPMTTLSIDDLEVRYSALFRQIVSQKLSKTLRTIFLRHLDWSAETGA